MSNANANAPAEADLECGTCSKWMRSRHFHLFQDCGYGYGWKYWNALLLATAIAWFWRFRMKWHTVWCIRFSSGASVWCRIKLGPLKAYWSTVFYWICLLSSGAGCCQHHVLQGATRVSHFEIAFLFRIFHTMTLWHIFCDDLWSHLTSKWFHNRDRCLVYKTDIICEIYNMQSHNTRPLRQNLINHYPGL